MVLLTWLRNSFAWWPLHPIGLAISFVTPGAQFWFSIFLAWLVKSGVLKYGGARVYQALLPLFLGFILGAFFAAGLWNVILFLTGESGICLTWG
jgi:hypothetical protein